jgi:hypothetical protein
LSGQMSSGQIYFWANVFLGKCCLGKSNVVWANVFLGKCLSGQTLSRQMSPWANVVWANVSGQMSLGKCRLGKCHGTVRLTRCPPARPGKQSMRRGGTEEKRREYMGMEGSQF